MKKVLQVTSSNQERPTLNKRVGCSVNELNNKAVRLYLYTPRAKALRGSTTAGESRSSIQDSSRHTQSSQVISSILEDSVEVHRCVLHVRGRDVDLTVAAYCEPTSSGRAVMQGDVPTKNRDAARVWNPIDMKTDSSTDSWRLKQHEIAHPPPLLPSTSTTMVRGGDELHRPS